MLFVTVGVAAAVGLVGGLLTPLPAYRLAVAVDQPARSTCSACGVALARGLAGWLRVPARCGRCGARWGPRAWQTAVVGAVAAGALGLALGDNPAWPLFVALCPLGVLLGVIDIACKRLPDQLVLPALGVSTALFVGVGLFNGESGTAVRAVLAGLALGGGFLVLALPPGIGLGLGDVKLAALLGLYAGWLGWPVVLLCGLLGLMVNGVVVSALLVIGRVGRKSRLPLGPALLVGALLAVLVRAWLGVVAGQSTVVLAHP